MSRCSNIITIFGVGATLRLLNLNCVFRKSILDGFALWPRLGFELLTGYMPLYDMKILP